MYTYISTKVYVGLICHFLPEQSIVFVYLSILHGFLFKENFKKNHGLDDMGILRRLTLSVTTEHGKLCRNSH